jgi:PH domain/Swiss Army Knife protein, DSP-PTPase phosphatase domain
LIDSANFEKEKKTMRKALVSAAREKVSADKNRYRESNCNLDLTYITERVVAMAFPADGVESAYRNNIDAVARLLSDSHGKRYLIYNLTSERFYDCEKFNRQVITWSGFPDHHPPPLALLFRIVHSMHAWLSTDSRNVVVVHCLAGKGRTGTIIACYLVFCGMFASIGDALCFFAARRSRNNWGVTGPTQLRYVDYFSDIFTLGRAPAERHRELCSVTLRGGVAALALAPGKHGCCPFFEVRIAASLHLLYSSEGAGDQETRAYALGHPSPIEFGVGATLPPTDLLVHFKHVTALYGTESMFHVGFHVGMVGNDGALVLNKWQLDKGYKDARLAPDFAVVFQFAPVGDDDDDDSDVAAALAAEKGKERRLWRIKPAAGTNGRQHDGSICFRNSDALQRKLVLAHDVAMPWRGAVTERGGYLLKLGHVRKNWKRRWFVLHCATLAYFKSPRDSSPAGEVPIDQVRSISLEHSFVKEKHHPALLECIRIRTAKDTSLLITSESASELQFWLASIQHAHNLHLQRLNSKEASGGSKDGAGKEASKRRLVGEIQCRVMALRHLVGGTESLRCVFSMGTQRFDVSADRCNCAKHSFPLQLSFALPSDLDAAVLTVALWRRRHRTSSLSSSSSPPRTGGAPEPSSSPDASVPLLNLATTAAAASLSSSSSDSSTFEQCLGIVQIPYDCIATKPGSSLHSQWFKFAEPKFLQEESQWHSASPRSSRYGGADIALELIADLRRCRRSNRNSSSSSSSPPLNVASASLSLDSIDDVDQLEHLVRFNNGSHLYDHAIE